MASRSQRCEEQWGSHFKSCQQTIQTAVSYCSTHHTVLVFGAGSLKDVPVDILSRRFKKVILVDLLFLKSARQRVKGFSNVELVEADITESIASIYTGSAHLSTPQRWLDCSDISLVVSLNVITQLPLLPSKWLMKRFGFNEFEINRFIKQMIQQHIDYLQNFSGLSCLIADRWDTEFDYLGNKVDEFDPWWEVAQPATVEEWDWVLVPRGEGRNKIVQKNRVGVSFLNLSRPAKI